MKTTLFLLQFCLVSSIFAQKKLEKQEEKPVFVKVHAFKVTPLEFLNRHTVFAYERLLKPDRSVEYRLDVIGLGTKTVIKSRKKGLILTIGYKFISESSKKSNYPAIYGLRGTYLEPEASLGYTNESYMHQTFVNGVKKIPEIRFENTTIASLGLSLGIQKIHTKKFLFNYFVNFGISAFSPKKSFPAISNSNVLAIEADKNGIGTNRSFKIGCFIGFADLMKK
jgi:hypothetical protein